MRFTCLKTDIAQAIVNVQRVVAAKAALPVLEGVLIKAENDSICISAYDLEIGITTNIEASVSMPGEVVLSARLFSDIIRRLPEEIVSIETDERLITYIKSGRTDYQIVGMSSVEFPDLPTFEKTDSVFIKAGLIKEMIRQTVFAVSDNSAKPIYTGSLFEIKNKKLRIVAIDGFRLALREEEIESEVENRFVVPGKTQKEVLNILTDDDKNVEINIGKRHISFKIENYEIISRLIDGEFLDYDATIPKTTKTEIIINARVFYDSVERMALLNNDRIKSPVKISIFKDEMRLLCSTSVGKANDSIKISTIGDEVEIGFNNRFLMDALKNTDTDEVKLVLNGPLSPMIVKPAQGDNYVMLVVPMRLNAEG
ncbi:MAG: DNA polymerase III subunit beta [Oscillospiraceae bacterium]|nr:DNA polymerase III subunit beta [Oscillospiraceae bacterium]